MINIVPVLHNVKELIQSLNIYKSVKLGLEKGADKAINCPFARIIVDEIEHRGALIDLHLSIVIAFNTKNDYEKLYEEFFTAEYTTKMSLFKLPYKIELITSITDEDRLVNLKAGIIKFKIIGLCNAN